MLEDKLDLLSSVVRELRKDKRFVITSCSIIRADDKILVAGIFIKMQDKITAIVYQDNGNIIELSAGSLNLTCRSMSKIVVDSIIKEFLAIEYKN
jgi:hypothetical protein